ncbi:unnamed protein product [Linum tenue]|uniref:Cytochrome P450 n=1 Tax=Linum tenue TaxID=586396 RepID=A0AAV0MZE1_9ROSI|nr:unnamed protein product [Linum tenue]
MEISAEYYYCAIALCLSFLAYRFLGRWIKHDSPLPPSPTALPLIGHLHLVKPPLHLSLQNLLSHYGPILSLKLGRRRALVLSSPSAVEECFTKNDAVFANRPRTMAGDHFTYNYRAYVWAPYGDLWRALRRLTVAEIFSPKTLLRSAAVREEEVRALVRRLGRSEISGGGAAPVDLKFLLSLLTINVMMRLAVGRRCAEEEEAGTEEERGKFQEFKEKFFPSLGMNICDFVPILRAVGFKGIEKKMVKLRKERDEYFRRVVDGVVERRHRRRGEGDSGTGSDGEEVRSVAEIILSLRESDPEFYSDDVVNGSIAMMFVAGTETTSITLEWAMTLLLDHPRVMQKLKAEIDSNIGHEQLLNERDTAKLPYLKCVINETLRLYPPAPLLLPHRSSENCTVEGYQVPKDTTLMVNVWAMHRDPKLWDEADKFVPERFEVVDSKEDAVAGGEGCKYAPFGMGRRACPGAGMGMNLVSLALGSLIQCFEWEKVGQDVEDMTAKIGMALSKSKPLEAKCSPRRDIGELLSHV